MAVDTTVDAVVVAAEVSVSVFTAVDIELVQEFQPEVTVSVNPALSVPVSVDVIKVVPSVMVGASVTVPVVALNGCSTVMVTLSDWVTVTVLVSVPTTLVVLDVSTTVGTTTTLVAVAVVDAVSVIVVRAVAVSTIVVVMVSGVPVMVLCTSVPVGTTSDVIVPWTLGCSATVDVCVAIEVEACGLGLAETRAERNRVMRMVGLILQWAQKFILAGDRRGAFEETK